MCWNKEVSMFTFVVVLGVSYKLFKRNLPRPVTTFFIISGVCNYLNL